MPESAYWDVFCSVVDNYGDAGIAWRLARMLASEHGLTVRLYVDALPTLARLVPQVDATANAQRVDGVDVRIWGGPRSPFPSPRPGVVTVEAFGCGLPEPYLAAMAMRDKPPVWINLEYLSAESWIESCQGLPSRHPSLPLTRYFFFPGFTDVSGGLLREHDLFARRDSFRVDPDARASLWRTLGLPVPTQDSLCASLFCYPEAPIAELLDTWAAGEIPIVCIVPCRVAEAAIRRWLGRATIPQAGLARGNLFLFRVPFLPQAEYDGLLWACDVNFVRGEDSFVRGQWAARPLVWNLYPQDEDAHRLKLEAFLDRYTAGLPADAACAVAALSRAWNGEGEAGPGWHAFLAHRAAVTAHAQRWATALGAKHELASTLVRFCVDRL